MDVVVNELLCYVQNDMSNHPRALVGVAINGFYQDDEVSAAKQCLYTVVEPMKLDGVPRHIKRQAGDNKHKMECEDILNLFSFMDSVQCTMPKFVAADLQRIPNAQPGDVDVCSLAANVAAMTLQFDALSKRFDESVTETSSRVKSIL